MKDKNLWKKYKKNKKLKGNLVATYKHLCIKAVKDVKTTLPNFIDKSDLYQIALMELNKQIDRYKLKFNTSFSAFVYSRLKGSILDYLRKVSKKRDPIYFIENSLNVKVDQDVEIIDLLECRIEHDPSYEDNSNYITETIVDTLKNNFSNLVSKIFILYFLENLTLNEVSRVLKVSENKITSLLNQHKIELRRLLEAKQLRSYL